MRQLGIAPLRIEIVGKVDAATADTVVRALASYPGHHVELSLSCDGGCWYSALVIYGALKGHARHVRASIGHAASAGSLIMMAADERVMQSAESYVWLHWPIQTSGAPNPEFIAEVAATKAALISQNCRIPSDTVLRWMRQETHIGAARALALGIVDAVPGLKKPQVPVVCL